MRHLTVAFVVVLLVNAQLSWWIIYTLRENRTRLRLERNLLEVKSQLEALHIGTTLQQAETLLRLEALRAPDLPRGKPLAPVFSSVRRIPGEACDEGWSQVDGRLVLRMPASSACLEAEADPAWIDELLRPSSGIEVGEPEKDISGTKLPVPFETLEARPSRAAWTALLHPYKRRIVMVVSEGTFFAVMLLVMMWLLLKTVRREVELERQHQNFLSAITHELKSPLAAMRLSLETVLRGRADRSASVRFLENAVQDTERLQSLVQKVLEVTRYGLPSHGLNPVRTDLSQIVEETVARFQSRALSAGARMHSEIEPGIFCSVDVEALPIVISNLLENAIKYGGTLLEVSVLLDNRDGRAVIEVRDNGAGIPQDDVPFIFNRFFRGGDEMTRTARGTGLGLHLVQQIIAGHGGTAEVAQTGPQGTTFRIVLPGAEREAVESEGEAV